MPWYERREQLRSSIRIVYKVEYHLRTNATLENTPPERIYKLRNDTTDVKHADTIRSQLFKYRLSKGKQNHSVTERVQNV